MSKRLALSSKIAALSLLALPAVALAQALVAPPANPPAAASPNDATPPAPAPDSALTAPSAGPEGVTVIGPAPVSTGVVALVNDYVISDYDLDQRVKLFVATSGGEVNKDMLPQIRAQVLRSMEDEILELQEAAMHKINVTKPDVDKALQNIADDNHITVDQILATITRGGVKVDTFRQQVAAQLVWQKLVSARFGADVVINDDQIDQAMERLRKGADKPQFLVEEIFLAVDKPEDDMSVHTSADEMVKQINGGAPFNAVASQFSQSPSAASGGQIGWVIQGQLADELDRALTNAKPGQILGPIHAEGGYYILMLRDRREPIGFVPVAAETPPPKNDPDAPVQLDRLLIPLPANATDDLKQRALNLVTSLRTRVKSCADLPAASAQIQGTVYNHFGLVNPKDLAQNVRDALAKSEPGEIVPPFFDTLGLEIFMRCDASLTQKVETVKLPTREELQQQLYVQQMSVFAKSYLRDLRRDAVVETR